MATGETIDSAAECWCAAARAVAAAAQRGELLVPPRPATLAKLRQEVSPQVATLAVELAEARDRAVGKLAAPDCLWLDRAGVEQATASAVAEHKALRFAKLRLPVSDLCCGIGGDAMALAAVTSDLVVVDRDPLRVAAARHNVESGGRVVAAAEVRDVATVEVAGRAIHVDPARRVEVEGGLLGERDGVRRRLWSLSDYRPGPEVLERLIGQAVGAAIKLGPGLDFAELPARDERELEWIAHRGSLREAVWWCGALASAPGCHRATDLGRGESFVAPPARLDLGTASAREFLWLPHAAIERADLVQPLLEQSVDGLVPAELASGLGVLTATAPAPTGWLTSFRVLADLPWRPGKVRAALRALDAGIVTVRSRGGAVDASRVARELRGTGDRDLVVFVLRVGSHKLRAFVTEPPDGA